MTGRLEGCTSDEVPRCPQRQGIIYPDCVGEAAPTLGGGKGREGGKRKRREEEAGSSD